MTTDTGQQIWSFVGRIITAGGGGAVVAYAIFRVLGKGWIEHQFARELEVAKSEISILSARRLKLHDREHVVFPGLWSRLNKVFVSLHRAVVSVRHVPEFQQMTPSDLDSWVNSSDLSEDEKSYFNSEKDKGRAYGRILDWRDLNRAKRDFFKFQKYLRDNRIFLNPEVKDKLDEIDKLINASLVAREMDWKRLGRGTGKDFLSEAWDTLDKQVKPLMGEIESLVQARLFPDSRKGNKAGAKK